MRTTFVFKGMWHRPTEAGTIAQNLYLQTKMKKNYFWSLLAIMLAAMLSFSFTSCSDDDDETVSNTSLVGTWYYLSEDEKSDNGWNSADVSVFTESTRAYYIIEKKSGEWKLDPSPEMYTYTLDGNKMSLTAAKDGESFEVKIAFHGNSLTITEEYEGEVYTYDHKKFNGTPQELTDYLNGK